MTTGTDALTALETVIRAINGGSTEAVKALADGVANEHPTLSGQLAKAVAIGLMRRSTREPDWSAFRAYDQFCDEPDKILEFGDGTGITMPRHAAHDGRHSCELVIGAELMARQFYV